MKVEEVEYQIEEILSNNSSDLIIFDQLLKIIADQNNLSVKKIKSILYHNKSVYYGTSGYIDGKRISIQNLSITSKKIFKKIIKQIEKDFQFSLVPEEKIKILKYIEYNLGEQNAFI